MPKADFPPEVLRHFLLGQLSGKENREVVRHLLRGCRRCSETLDGLWPPEAGDGQAAAVASGAGTSLLAVLEERQARLAQERRQAPERLRELDDLPLGRQWTVVGNSRRFHTWGVCEALLKESWERRFDDAPRTLELAELAVLATEKLPLELYGPRLIYDLSARAWSYLGNARRIHSDYRSADDAFHFAELFLAEGTGDPLEKAGVLRLKAALRSTQERFAEARDILHQVMAIYRRAGDPHALGAAMAETGRIFGLLHDPETAARLLRRSLDLIDPERDLARYLASRHNLVCFLHESGELEEALTLLEETRPLYEALEDRLNLLRLLWLEGKIALTQGRESQAEAAFLEVRDGFIEQEIGYEAAEVCLDLAAIYARQGRKREMRRLALDMLPIFHSRDMHTQALAAVLVFHRAAEEEAASLELIQEVRAYLEKARNNPDLRFSF